MFKPGGQITSRPITGAQIEHSGIQPYRLDEMGKQDSSDSSSIKVHPTDANGSKLTSGPTDTHRTRRGVGLQVDQPKFGRV